MASSERLATDNTLKNLVTAVNGVRDVLRGGASTVYAFHIDANESDPAEAVTYREDAVGMTPAYMDYTNDVFNYGSWGDAFFMPRPCMLKSDGTVDYYLDPDDYSKKIDGTTASDVGNTAYDGNAMMEWGRGGKKIYYKVVPDTGDDASGTVYIADGKVDEDYQCWSFINNKGDLVDHFYTPIYNGSIVSSKMRSLSGQTVSNKTTATQEKTAAQLNNPSTDLLWNIECIADRILINFLCVLITKTLDSQTAFGQGANSGGSEAVNNTFTTGVHNAKGMFYGTNSGAVSSNDFANCVKIFGMENYYGFQWRRQNGWIKVNSDQRLKLTNGTEDGSTANGYNEDGTGYISLGAAPTGTSGGYIKKSKFTQYGLLPYDASGDSTHYYCDGLWFNNGATTFALVGGSSASSSQVGVWSAYLSPGAGASHWAIGAALSCKPLA